ncbi:MAG: tetratricopeptide repeat protein [Alphaproteobacteria bacterium]
MALPIPQRGDRKLAAILFADICGYAGMMSRDEDATLNRVTQAMGQLRTLVGDYGGQIANIAGDGVLAVFETASQATNFAIELQREMARSAVWTAPEDAIAFRVGINVGEIMDSDSGLHGNAINVCVRVQDLAEPGGICITEVVRQALAGSMPGRTRAMGPQALKNIGEPVEVFELDFDEGATIVAAEPRRDPMVKVRRAESASIALLPFANRSGNAGDEHLCEGVVGDVVNQLTRFRGLLVTATHSARVLVSRNVPVDQIGQRLGVRYLLQGGVQRNGRRLRVNVELIEAATEEHLWSERYEGELSEVFTIQDDMTQRITASLAVQVGEAERRRLVDSAPSDLQAYGLILRGQYLASQWRRESVAHARRLFEQATKTDPDYARSYASMSRAFNLDWRYRWSDSPETRLQQAIDLARAAVSRDPYDSRGHAELAFALLYNKDYSASLAAYERALNLNPNDADLLAEAGDALTYLGDAKRAEKLIIRAMRLNPYYPDWYLWYLADAYFDLGDYEKTISVVKQMSDRTEGHRLLASSYAHLNMMSEARYHANEVMRIHPTFSISHWRVVLPHKDHDKMENFVAGLRKAGLE